MRTHGPNVILDAPAAAGQMIRAPAPAINSKTEKTQRRSSRIMTRFRRGSSNAESKTEDVVSIENHLPTEGGKIRSGAQQVLGFKWVIDPVTTGWVTYWDLVTTLALIYTAIVTPVEVAFISPPSAAERWTDTLFLCNRCVDVIFIVDLALQFRIAIKITDTDGTRWVRTGREVARRYVTSKWFYLDFFSVCTAVFDLLPDGGAKDLLILRAVRVLRLAKLIRLAKGSRVFKKWELRISINYPILSLVSTFAMIIAGCHWFACIWGLQASFYVLDSWYASTGYCVAWDPLLDDCTGDNIMGGWGEGNRGYVCEIQACEYNALGDITSCTGHMCVAAGYRYVYSLYFVIMTVTSVGYGDILATPMNVPEQIIATLIMLLSGMLWGYLIGAFCGLAAALSPSVLAFREELSALNHMMDLWHIPDELRYRLREYFHETVHLADTTARNNLLHKLSPKMQKEVYWLINKRWISRVWYLMPEEEEDLCIDIAYKLGAHVFPPYEFVPAGRMYIVQRGAAFYANRFRRDGAVWGEDVMLESDLELSFPALAGGYLWVYAIEGKTLQELIHAHRDTDIRLASLRRNINVRRAVVRAAERKCFEEGRSFMGRVRPIYAKDVAYRIQQREQQRVDRLKGRKTAVTKMTDRRPRALDLLAAEPLRASTGDSVGSSPESSRASKALPMLRAGSPDMGFSPEKKDRSDRIDAVEERLLARLEDRIEKALVRVLGETKPSGSPLARFEA